jgi:hypothetical protein
VPNTNTTNGDIHSVIKFLKVKNICPAKNPLQLVEVHEEGVMNEENVSKNDLNTNLSSQRM